MGKALYRKYRSKSFDEVIGQEHITKTLQNSLKNNNFSHAYLLTGPRGVGKTSIARIFAFEVNNQKYSEDQSLSDIIEIDAASNRRIDEMRELREKISTAPNYLKYKVYIIDEVHMLTREAFNALLKTLEEPPEHAIFILATTDFHKVPETIVSRCVRFSFKRIEQEQLKTHLKDIANREKIKIDGPALDIIAKVSDGSFRDGLVLIDQIRNYADKITAKEVEQAIGLASDDLLANLYNNLKQKNAGGVINSLQAARDNGSIDSLITNQLSELLRAEMVGDKNNGFSTEEIIQLLESLLSAGTYKDTGPALEVALLKHCSKLEESNYIQSEPVKDGIDAVQNTTTDMIDLWPAALAKLKDSNRTLYGIARMAKPSLEDTRILLKFEFPFHHKQISLEKNKKLVSDIVRSIDKNIAEVSIELEQELKPGLVPKTKASEADDKAMSNISNIFGSAEMLD